MIILPRLKSGTMIELYETGLPIPDGKLVVIGTNNSITTFYFKDLILWDRDEVALHVNTHKHLKLIPWSSISTLIIERNSEEYLEALEHYQNNHKHNWVHKEASAMDRYGIMVCLNTKHEENTGCNLSRIFTNKEIEDFVAVLNIRSDLYLKDEFNG